MIGEKIKTNAENIVGGIKKVGKRNLVICVMVLLVAASVCINWALYSGAQTPPADDQAGVTDGNTEQTGTNNDNDNVASYFASVQISRQQARDEALEVLQLVIDSESAVESAKAEAIADVSRIADEIASEANIETLVKAKGFEDCIAVINDGNANIIVKTESALMQNQVAQIMEIVYEQASISPENIKITEKY
ncbi:MAG: SpoIIIAH-like family protein [Ruminococcaceae bacterium]|nr:SpoIIIAH-like family protein [Oscillospiraceae bacterium]